MNDITEKNRTQNPLALNYKFEGRQVEIHPNALPDDGGLFKDAIFIDEQPLAVRRRNGGGYYSAFNFYEAFATLQNTANAAVVALDDSQLAPFLEGRVGKLPKGLPDLNNPGPLRVRKNILRMTAEERDQFINAVLELKHRYNINVGCYDDMVRVHVDTMIDHSWSAHGNALLPWHRLYVYHFESLLRALPGFENVTVPYWDWTQPLENGVLPFTDNFLGGGGEIPDNGEQGNVLTGPFAYEIGRWNTFVRPTMFDPNPEPSLKRRRADQLFGQTIVQPTELQRLLAIDRFVDQNNSGFNHQANQILHNPPHNVVGGDMGGDASPNDPIFWMHHCMLDKAWADWQERHSDTPHYEEDPSDMHPIAPDAALEPWLEDIGRRVTSNDLVDYKRLYIYE
ncbi:tyrosinase family oxidase copper chaperone [Dyella sp. 2HG41-7]|uniref:tyrosinase family protein n=1 Tax=Dyella sp. 2HG41-7 TaxID=2883239 RepID=UPI001F18DB0D|nr:tyrosinase family oxidase copper chaperone [Dyella sp. 2HG41-7]